MIQLRITKGDDDSAEAELVRNGLYAFNFASTPYSHSDDVAFFLKDNDGQIAGGILGYEWGGWLHITHLWVSEAFRGHGFGERLLTAAEHHAIDHGCHQSILETFSFQARPFYERFGYVVAGQIDGYPDGYTCYFMKKPLTS
jgi:GNAT superfamily N-acetyltransferase